MADYWIKWYHEILDDPKMATLPDRLWRRFSELCLLAGKLGGTEKSGQLPDTRQLAWMLRMNTDDLQLDLVQLSRIDLIEAIPNGWIIPKFQERQSAVSGADRVRYHRERKQKQQYNGDVTNEKRFVTQNQNRTETETEDPQPPNIFTLYEHEIGIITPAIADRIGLAETEYPAEWFGEAFREAAAHNKRSWAYCEAILKGWKTNGFKAGKSNNGGSGRLLPEGI